MQNSISKVLKNQKLIGWSIKDKDQWLDIRFSSHLMYDIDHSLFL